MEVLSLPDHDGKLRVVFEGNPLGCFHDSDCPRGGICAINKSWAADLGGWCMCNTKAGLTGAECDELCAQGEAILGINIAAACLSLALIIVSTACMLTLLRHGGGGSLYMPSTRRDVGGLCSRQRKAVTPVCMTMLFILSGSVFLCVSSILSSIVSVGFADVARLHSDPDLPERLIRRIDPGLEVAAHVTTALGYSLGICSIAVLPLTWIHVAQRSLKLRNSRSNRIAILVSAGFILLTICFELTFYILAGSDFGSNENRWTTAAVICWGIIFLIIVALNLVALVKITQVKWSTSLSTLSPRLSRSTAASNRSGSSSGQSLLVVSGDMIGMQRLMTRIQVTCIVLILLSCLIMTLISFFAVRSNRTIEDDPRCFLDTYDLLYRSSILAVLVACAVCIWFVLPSVFSLQRRSKRLDSGYSSFNNSSVIFNGASQFGASPMRAGEGAMHSHHFLFKSRPNSKDAEGGAQPPQDHEMHVVGKIDNDDDGDIRGHSSIDRRDTLSPVIFQDESKQTATPTKVDIPNTPSRMLAMV